MSLLTIAFLVVCFLFWFFESWGKNRDRAELLRTLDEAEEATYQRERTYREDLRTKRDAGDQQAASLLKWHGWA